VETPQYLYLTSTIAIVAQCRSTDRAACVKPHARSKFGMLNFMPEWSLVSAASFCQSLCLEHPAITCSLLLILQLLNINLKVNFLSEHSTTDREHSISAPGRLHIAVVYKFHLYCIVTACIEYVSHHWSLLVKDCLGVVCEIVHDLTLPAWSRLDWDTAVYCKGSVYLIS